MFEAISEGHRIMAEGPKKEIDLEQRIRELEAENADLKNQLRDALERC